MLGKALVPCLDNRAHAVAARPRDVLDVTNYKQVIENLEHSTPDLVIHAAAYTQVDQAETDVDAAFLVNGYGTENVAVACNHLKIPMVYVSTDYVFDGESGIPYTPWDKTRPLSIYGKSKLAGELACARHLNKFYIVRTSWLYGPHGKNFVETILKIAKEKKQLRVVADQWGSPTSTISLAEIIASLIETERWGVYHATDGGVTNWCDFARKITEGMNVEVEAIKTEDMPRPAPRPKYSVLDKTTLIRTIGHELTPWEEALANYLQLRSPA